MSSSFARIPCQLDWIMKGKNAVRWRQATDCVHPSWPATEFATDSIRCSAIGLDNPVAETVVLTSNNGATTAPSIADIWPKISTLPHALTIPSAAVARIAALGKYADTLRSSKTAPALAGDISRDGENRIRIEIRAPRNQITVLMLDCNVSEGAPKIAFNLTYLAEAAGEWGGTMHFDTYIRPGLFVPADHAPLVAARTILMPVNHK